MNNNDSKNIVQTLVLAGIIIFILLLVPEFIGLGKSGFSFVVGSGDITGINFLLFQFLFYSGPGVGFLLGILIFFIVELVIKKDDYKFGSSLSFNSPGETPAPATKYFSGWKGMIKLTLLSIIIFSLLGLYTVFTGNSFTGVGNLQHQFTIFDNLLYSAALVAVSENLGAAFFWAMILVFIRAFARNVKMNKDGFIIFSVIMCILAYLTYGFVLHQLRYQGSEVALISVLIFWAVGGLITILSGSFIPFWIMHIANNLFYDLSKYYSSDIIFIWTIGSIIFLGLIYVVAFIRRNNR
jgi:hypothetical protein